MEKFLRSLAQYLDHLLATIVDYAWGMPLMIILVFGGLFLTFYSRCIPFRGFFRGVAILRGHHEERNAPGQVSHFQALMTALSSTIGLGNIGGVAIAITQGGPGAVFWMWVAALVGMATKFFTCTLAVMYRGQDSIGEVQGGPMYFIEVGLGRSWRFLAIFFSLFGMIGCLALFQSNQLSKLFEKTYDINPHITGVLCVLVVSVVVLGGIHRIAAVASRLVPAMCILYLILVSTILILNFREIPSILYQIVHDAFCGTAAVGGAQGIAWYVVIQTGIKRAAFSNEAGIGTAPMAHGAAQTNEPVREGLVAMLGPFIDTIIICTLTALAVLSTGQWKNPEANIEGVTLTARAFKVSLGMFGEISLITIVALFGLTTMFGYSYYGKKCFSYLFGAHRARIYDFIYLAMLYAGAVWSAKMVINIIDIAFAMMTLPTMVATFILAPRVMKVTGEYLARDKKERKYPCP